MIGPSGTSGRRGALAALAAALLALGLLAAPAGAATDPGGIPFIPAGSGQLSSTVLGVISSQSGAGDALDAIGDSLALAEARNRVEARLKREAAEATKAAPGQGAEPASEGTPAPAQPISEEIKNPAEMIPASAGSNGTHVPPTSNLSREAIFAHTRAGEEGSTAILLSGVALAPPDAPPAVQSVINAANTIVGRPYIWGGGHAGFYSYGYDCSGSVSFALFGGGLIPEPLTSGSLEGWGDPGPGKWITIYANAGHTFAEIAGLRWDTVGDTRGTGPRWHLAPNSHAGFVVRHPPGL